MVYHFHDTSANSPMRQSEIVEDFAKLRGNALLQPDSPSIIIIDEPELGMHPATIVVLAELIQAAAKQTQVIVATQSPAFIDQFCIDDIIVVNRKNGASTFERLKEEDFSVWLEDYSVGELWEKNLIVGGPSHE